MFNWLHKIGTSGLKLPLAWNGKLPGSERLLFSHLSFYIAAASIIFNVPQAWTAICFFVLCTVLHMFKEVDKFKISGADRSVEIEDTPDTATPEAPEVTK